MGALEVTDDPSASAWRAALESADYWPMANIILQTLGGKPKQLSASGVSCGRHPPLEERISHPAWCCIPALQAACGGPLLGELSGGKWMAVGSRLSAAHGLPCQSRPCFGTLLLSETTLPGPLCRGFRRRGSLLASVKIVTWLILPVVICLSQRLSHACLSISNLYCETANGSLNQLSFI